MDQQEKMVVWTIEVDDDLYASVTRICALWGTTIEAITEAFIRFCVIPENLPLVEAFFNGAEDRLEVNRKVFRSVLDIAKSNRGE